MASPRGILSKITKFNGRNYALWKHLIKRILESEGLHAVAFDDKLPPAIDDEKKEWLSSDNEAKSIILSHLDEKNLKLTEDCKHSKDILDKLDATYGQRNLIRKMCAEENFHAYKMKSSDTIAEHVSMVEELAQKIRDVGGEVSDVMVMAKILSSLSREFYDMGEGWLAKSSENDTLEDLKAALMKEEKIILQHEAMGKFPLLKRHRQHRRMPFNPYQRRRGNLAAKPQKANRSLKN